MIGPAATVALALLAAAPQRLVLLGSTGRALVLAVEDEGLGGPERVRRSHHLVLDERGELSTLVVPAVTMRAPGRLPAQHLTYAGATLSGAYALLWLDDTLWTVEVTTRRATAWPKLCAPGAPVILAASDGDVVACRGAAGAWCHLDLASGARGCTSQALVDLAIAGGRVWLVDDDGITLRVRTSGSDEVQPVPLPERGPSLFSAGSVLVLGARALGVTRLGQWPHVVHNRWALDPPAAAITVVDQQIVVLHMSAAGMTAALAEPFAPQTTLALRSTHVVREAGSTFVEWSDPDASAAHYAMQGLRVIDGAVVAAPVSYGRVGCASGRCWATASDGSSFTYDERDFRTLADSSAARGAHFFSAGTVVVEVNCRGTPVGTRELDCVVERLPRVIVDGVAHDVRRGAAPRVVFGGP